jgi:hypothetical protein
MTPDFRRLRAAIDHPVVLRVTGDFAEFSAAQTAPNKLSSPIIPPSVASAIAKSIMGRPCMRWLTLDIVSMRMPHYISVMRNEPDFPARGQPTKWLPIHHSMLCKVEYFVQVCPYVFCDLVDQSPLKFANMLRSRAEKGQYHKPPSLGPASCLADVELVGSMPPEGCPDFNANATPFFGFKRKLNGRLVPVLFSKRATIERGRMRCAPWEFLSDDDMDMVLDKTGEIVVRPDGTYERA